MNTTKFYGWKLVGVLFLVYFAANAVLLGGNIANTYMSKQAEWSRSFFSLGFALAYLLVGLASPLAAGVAKKRGEGFIVSTGLIAVCLGCVLMLFMGNVKWCYILAYGLIIGVGCSFATVLPIQTLITRWFQRKRAVATGVVLSAGGIAGLISSVLIDKIIQSTGKNWIAWLFLAVLTGIAAIVAMFFIKNNPEDLGQVADGIEADEKNSNSSQSRNETRVFQTKVPWILKDAMKTPALWILLLAAVAQFSTFYLYQNHSTILLMDKGFANNIAALSQGILLFASVGGRLLAGVLGDRIEPRFIMMCGLVMTLAGSLVLLSAPGLIFIYVYASLVGIGFGLVYVCLFTMLGNYFGTANIRSFLGFMIPIVTLFGAMGPTLGGIIKDKTGNYDMAFIIAIVITAVGAFALLFGKPPVKKILTANERE